VQSVRAERQLTRCCVLHHARTRGTSMPVYCIQLPGRQRCHPTSWLALLENARLLARWHVAAKASGKFTKSTTCECMHGGGVQPWHLALLVWCASAAQYDARFYLHAHDICCGESASAKPNGCRTPNQQAAQLGNNRFASHCPRIVRQLNLRVNALSVGAETAIAALTCLLTWNDAA
jgi:hypothetical protein